MTVRELDAAEWPEWARMRAELWPDHTVTEHEAEMPKWAARDDTIVLVALRPDGRLCGFAEVGTRPYADGCDTSPVAYLEGWYVDADCRGAGYGRLLIEAAERWARERGLQEFASDALLENEASHRAHERVGFTEVERAVRYRKVLTEPWLF